MIVTVAEGAAATMRGRFAQPPLAMTSHRADLLPDPLPWAPADAAVEIHLHMQSRRAGKISGEARAPGHVDDIDLTGWQWRAQASVAMNRPACTCQALTVHRRFDTATTALPWALVRNDEIREGRLTMRRPARAGGAEGEAVFTVMLNDARVVGLDQGVAADGGTWEIVTIESRVAKWLRDGRGDFLYVSMESSEEPLLAFYRQADDQFLACSPRQIFEATTAVGRKALHAALMAFNDEPRRRVSADLALDIRAVL